MPQTTPNKNHFWRDWEGQDGVGEPGQCLKLSSRDGDRVRPVIYQISSGRSFELLLRSFKHCK